MAPLSATRFARHAVIIAVLAGGVGAPSLVRAQDPPASRIADMIAQERAMVSPATVHTRCSSTPDDDFQTSPAIVVCGRTTDTRRYRIPSGIDANPRSLAARRDGAVHAPYVGSTRDCQDPDVTCHFIGHAPAPIYYFDITALPEPAEGSDAWLIAHGQMRDP